MTTVRAQSDGGVLVECPRYRLAVAPDGLPAEPSSPEGRHWAALRPLAALDRTGGVGETLTVEPPRVVDGGKYYVTHLDATGERLEAVDYAALRDTWQRWKAART